MGLAQEFRRFGWRQYGRCGWWWRWRRWWAWVSGRRTVLRRVSCTYSVLCGALPEEYFGPPQLLAVEGPQGQNLRKKYGVKEYISGFDPGGEDNNADGTHSDKDTIVNNSPPNQYDDTLGYPGGLNCQHGDFWQRFTVTILTGPDKGTQMPVLMKIGGNPETALHWQNNGRDATTPIDFKGPTLPLTPP